MKQHIVPSIYRFLHQQQNLFFSAKKADVLLRWSEK